MHKGPRNTNTRVSYVQKVVSAEEPSVTEASNSGQLPEEAFKLYTAASTGAIKSDQLGNPERVISSTSI